MTGKRCVLDLLSMSRLSNAEVVGHLRAIPNVGAWNEKVFDLDADMTEA